MRVKRLILPSLAALVLSGASQALAAGGGAAAANLKPSAHSSSGGVSMVAPPAPLSTRSHPIVQGFVGKIINGVAYAPSYAPIQVKRAIWAGNRIRHKPYIYGGGHGSFNDAGYDCSGAVSYVLHAGGLLDVPMDSSEFMGWGRGGSGHWITVYTNPGHAFIEIAGIRLDTSAEGDPNPPPGSGPRWRPLLGDTSSFSARHPQSF